LNETDDHLPTEYVFIGSLLCGILRGSFLRREEEDMGRRKGKIEIEVNFIISQAAPLPFLF
jgi:hypothetical protein